MTTNPKVVVGRIAIYGTDWTIWTTGTEGGEGS